MWVWCVGECFSLCDGDVFSLYCGFGVWKSVWVWVMGIWLCHLVCVCESVWWVWVIGINYVTWGVWDCLCNGDGDVVCILVPLEWSTGHCPLDTNTIVYWALPSQGQAGTIALDPTFGSFTLLVSLVKVFRLFGLKRTVLVFRVWTR
jgi:hypothetical protein